MKKKQITVIEVYCKDCIYNNTINNLYLDYNNKPLMGRCEHQKFCHLLNSYKDTCENYKPKNTNI